MAPIFSDRDRSALCKMFVATNGANIMMAIVNSEPVKYPNSLVIYFLNFFLNFSKMLFFEEDFSISLNL